MPDETVDIPPEVLPTAPNVVPDATRVGAGEQTAVSPTSGSGEQSELAEFDAYVEKWARNDGVSPSPPIFNKSAGHAAIVLKWIFRAARDRIEILTGRLNPAVYGQPAVIAALHDFMRRNIAARVTILFDNCGTGGGSPLTRDYVRQHPLVAPLLEDPATRDRVELGLVPVAQARIYEFHFVVADEDTYRFEGDRNSFEATAQFGNATLGQRLHAYFETLRAKKIALAA